MKFSKGKETLFNLPCVILLFICENVRKLNDVVLSFNNKFEWIFSLSYFI